MLNEQGVFNVKKFVILIAASLVAGVAVPSLAQTPLDANSSKAESQVVVVNKEVVRPAKEVRRKSKLRIPSTPTVSQVEQMINHEASLWGVSAASLKRRASCESGLRWWARNGQYEGVLQFAPSTFYRGLQSIQTLRVKIIDDKFRRMHSRVYWHWSNGRVTRTKGRVVRQLVHVKRIGKLPATVSNAWTQIRIGAQALRGISLVHSSEWSCGA